MSQLSSSDLVPVVDVSGAAVPLPVPHVVAVVAAVDSPSKKRDRDEGDVPSMTASPSHPAGSSPPKKSRSKDDGDVDVVVVAAAAPSEQVEDVIGGVVVAVAAAVDPVVVAVVQEQELVAVPTSVVATIATADDHVAVVDEKKEEQESAVIVVKDVKEEKENRHKPVALECALVAYVSLVSGKDVKEIVAKPGVTEAVMEILKSNYNLA